MATKASANIGTFSSGVMTTVFEAKLAGSAGNAITMDILANVEAASGPFLDESAFPYILVRLCSSPPGSTSVGDIEDLITASSAHVEVKTSGNRSYVLQGTDFPYSGASISPTSPMPFSGGVSDVSFLDSNDAPPIVSVVRLIIRHSSLVNEDSVYNPLHVNDDYWTNYVKPEYASLKPRNRLGDVYADELPHPTIPVAIDLEIIPLIALLGVGQTLQLQLLEVFSDGSTLDVTALAAWSSASPSVVSVSSTGLLTALTSAGEDDVVITASYNSFTVTVDVVVSDARDLYKSIILRNNMRRLFSRDRASTLAKVMSAIGQADNSIGGEFGKANFYGATPSPDELGQDRSAINQARDSMFVDTAEGNYLTTVGANNGVFRPYESPYDDDIFRKIIPAMSPYLPKTPMLVPYLLAEAIFGSQESLGANAWQFYEVNANEIIFECPLLLIAGNNSIASYMHGFAGLAVATGTTTVTVAGDDATKAASSLVGLIAKLTASGATQTATIASATYSSGINTFVLSAAVTSGNYAFYVDIPGSSSFSGDFMLSDASQVAGSPNPTSDALTYLFGQGVLDIFTNYMNLVRAAGVLLRIEVL